MSVFRNKIMASVLFLLIMQAPFVFSAEQAFPFKGAVNANKINIRADSTVTSTVICTVNKGDRLEVFSEHYDWYKVALPRKASLYIKKSLVENRKPADNTLLVAKDNVNLRLAPSESSAILGKVNKSDTLTVREDKGEWFKVEATKGFGWISKKFISKNISLPQDESPELNVTVTEIKLTPEPQNRIVSTPTEKETVTLEGIVKPYGMVFMRQATHKLILEDNKIFLLKGNKPTLDELNYRKVRISGIINYSGKYPTIEIEKIEKIE